MIYINNDDFDVDVKDNFYNNLNDIPKTRYESDNYDVQLVNSAPKGFNYADNYININENDTGHQLVYGSISIENNDSLNSGNLSKTHGFIGENIEINFNLNPYYFVNNIDYEITDAAQ